MKKRLIYLIMAVIGTIGFTGCGPGQNTQERSGTNVGMQTSPDRGATTVENRTNRTATTGTSGTRTTTTAPSVNTTTGSTDRRNSNSTVTNDANINTTANRPNFRLNEATDYSFNNENFRFTPDPRGINITRDVDGVQSTFGTMRSFGNDGYYMVTTTNASGEEEFSVGRFDESGHFTIYKYDKNGDRVTEQSYRSSTPIDQNRR